MKVGTLPVTKEYFVPQTSPLVIGYQGSIQLVKTGDREVFGVQSRHF